MMRFMVYWLALSFFACGLNGGHAATFVIQNVDGDGEGFNDPTPVEPVGGNTGTTIGEQRLQVFQAAGQIWGAVLQSAVEIIVQAKFDELDCNASTAVLGAAGPTFVFRDEEFLPKSETWYSSALANALAGSDQVLAGSPDAENAGIDADMTATFNSNIDNNDNCLAGIGWYYGLDGSPPDQSVDLLSTLLHELGHGLGFLTLYNQQSGELFQSFNDVFTANLRDHDLGKNWSEITAVERIASSTNFDGLVWYGPSVSSWLTALQAGTIGNRLKLYAPEFMVSGSSISHFDSTIQPSTLMEPIQTVSFTDIDNLTKAAMQDLGWSLIVPQFSSEAEIVVDMVMQSSSGLNTQVTGTLTVSNLGLQAIPSAEITITLPPELAVVSLPTGCVAADPNVLCTTGQVNPGERAIFSLPLTASLQGSYTVTATLSSTHVETVTENNTQQATVVFTDQIVDLSVSDQTIILEPDTEGTTLDIEIQNLSTASAETPRVRIQDVAQDGLTIGTLPSNCENAGEFIDCKLSDLVQNAPVTLSIPMTAIQEGASFSLPVIATSASVDNDLQDNSATITLTFNSTNGDEGDASDLPPANNASDDGGGEMNMGFIIIMLLLFFKVNRTLTRFKQ